MRYLPAENDIGPHASPWAAGLGPARSRRPWWERCCCYQPHYFSPSEHRNALNSSRSPIKCARCPRDRQGNVNRRPNALSEFRRFHPIPFRRRKSEVDDIVALS